MGEDFYWGKNEGCDFLDIDCKNEFHNEYCNDKFMNCSDDCQYKTKCYQSIFSNTCQISYIYKSCMNAGQYGNFYESFGNKSICQTIIVRLLLE